MPLLEQPKAKLSGLFPLSPQSLRAFEESYARLLAVVEERLNVEMRTHPDKYDRRQQALLKDLYRWFGGTLRGIYAFHLGDHLADEVYWLNSVLTSRGLKTQDAAKLIEAWAIALHGVIKPPEAGELARPLTAVQPFIPRFEQDRRVPEEKASAEVLKFLSLVLRGKRKDAADYALSLLGSGLPPENLSDNLVLPALRQIGLLWQTNQISATAEHAATDIIRYTIFRLFDSLPGEKNLPYRALLSCVPGDEHEITAEIMANFLEIKGWSVVFIGRSAPSEDIIEAVVNSRPEIIFLSVNLISHLPAADILIREVKERAPGVKIILSGAAALLAREILGKIVDGLAVGIKNAYEMALGLVS